MSSIKRDALAVGLATGAYGISYGVLAVGAGLTVAQTCSMSVLVFTGASQFAVVGVLGAGGGVLAAMAPALLLAARNGLYGLALVPVLRGRPLSRAVQSQLIIDESTCWSGAAHRSRSSCSRPRAQPPCCAPCPDPSASLRPSRRTPASPPQSASA